MRVLSKLLCCRLKLTTEEPRRGPTMEDVCHGDEESAGGLMEKRGEGGRESFLIGVQEDGQVGKN